MRHCENVTKIRHVSRASGCSERSSAAAAAAAAAGSSSFDAFRAQKSLAILQVRATERLYSTASAKPLFAL